jgi:hypothetical protein
MDTAQRNYLYMSVFPTPYHDWKLRGLSLRVNSRNCNLPNPRLQSFRSVTPRIGIGGVLDVVCDYYASL